MILDILLKIYIAWKNSKKPTSATSPEVAPSVENQKKNDIKKDGNMFISPQEILMGREVAAPLTPEMKQNLDILLVAVNKLRALWGKPLVVSSGYRPPAQNAAAGGAKASNHMICGAVDFKDDGSLAKFLISRLDVLEACGLWLESPDKTPGWVHVQIFAPKSGRRVFQP